MIRKQKNYKTLVTLATCVLNRQYVMTHCMYSTGQTMIYFRQSIKSCNVILDLFIHYSFSNQSHIPFSPLYNLSHELWNQFLVPFPYEAIFNGKTEHV